MIADFIYNFGEDTDPEMRFLKNVARHVGVTMAHYLVGLGIEWEVSDEERNDALYVCFGPRERVPYSEFLCNYVDHGVLNLLRGLSLEPKLTLARPDKHKQAFKSSMVEVMHYVTTNPTTRPVSIPYRVPVRVSLLNDNLILIQIATK
jgi:hypothetical protein